ncbi:hypothetical protein H8B15_14180 [Hymenobacter sp. BT507]|uniref:Uncharacterized protein n=1 Tax=Hymenobacter citatus TaxID=2763506 RepID=A0ABR7MNF2_9BACT|nr:hypothetical protein [Hymenobacter citatus]MBC6612073.1 hypothetical protein [Hymenobacter citatus]
METIAWTALNVILLILIVYAWIKVLAVLRRQIGIGLAALFLLSLSAFRSSSNSSPDLSENLLATNNRPTQSGNWSNYRYTQLNPVNKLFFLVEGKKDQGTVQPTGFHVTTSGLLLGHEWRPIMGSATFSYPNVYYHAVVLHDWKLLGMKLYTTTEEYYGYVPSTKSKKG